MRGRLILGLGLGLLAASAASAVTAPASDALERRPICAGPSGWAPREHAPSASRDGRVLAWSTETTPDGSYRVFVSAANGSDLQPVSVPGRGHDRPLAFSPDGRQVAIVRDGDPVRLILSSTRKADSRFITDTEWDELRRQWRTPDWSPDGRFYVQGEIDSLVVVSADGGPPRRIATPETGDNHSASWSPDGEWVAFAGEGEFGTEIHVVRADGSSLRRLGSGSDPRWSPDGSLIAFTLDNTHSHGGNVIGAIRPNGSGRRQLTKEHEGPDRRSASQVSWVDSRTLVFVSYQHRGGPHKVVDIHTIRSDGRGERRVTYQCHLGSRSDDRLSGSILRDTIRTFGGRDEVAPGPGADDVDAGAGNDVVQAARDGTRDLIRCGPGRDTVVADRRDRIARDCERVTRRAR